MQLQHIPYICVYIQIHELIQNSPYTHKLRPSWVFSSRHCHSPGFNHGEKCNLTGRLSLAGSTIFHIKEQLFLRCIQYAPERAESSLLKKIILSVSSQSYRSKVPSGRSDVQLQFISAFTEIHSRIFLSTYHIITG